MGKKKSNGNAAAPMGKHGQCGARIRELIAQGVSDPQEILNVIHKEFPWSKARASDVYYQRRKLKEIETYTNGAAALPAMRSRVDWNEIVPLLQEDRRDDLYRDAMTIIVGTR